VPVLEAATTRQSNLIVVSEESCVTAELTVDVCHQLLDVLGAEVMELDALCTADRNYAIRRLYSVDSLGVEPAPVDVRSRSVLDNTA